MGNIDTIVSVTISRNTRVPTQAGFGTPMIIAYHTKWGDRVREYSETDELVDDGFAVTDQVYLDMAAMKAQSPSPPTVKVGRRALANTQIVHLIPVTTDVGYEHTIEHNGTEYSYTVQAGDAVADIVAGLVTAMAATVDMTATDGTTHVICTADTAGTVHRYDAKKGLDMYDATVDPGLATDLNAIWAEDSDWYCGVLDSNSDAEIQAFYAWIEAKTLIGIVQSSDWDIRDAGETGDIATTMKTAAVTRTAGLYHTEIGNSAAASWAGRVLPINPGRATWAFKTLALIAADDLTTGELSAIEAKYWSHYTETGGYNITYDSKTPAGEYIDIIRGIDFSTARIQEYVFGALANNDKVAYTDPGIEVIKSQVWAALKICSSDDYPIFDPTSLVVRVPTIAELTAAQRATRILPSVVYQARLAGAIHGVTIRGEISV